MEGQKGPLKRVETFKDLEVSGPGYARRVSATCEVLLQGKWRVHILSAMRNGPTRLGQLARLVPNASKKVLTQHLRCLEAYGVVIRRDLSDTRLHVEYDLEPSVRDSITELLDELSTWGGLYLQRSGNRFHSSQNVSPEIVSGTQPVSKRNSTSMRKTLPAKLD